ncbi:hypothetical protein CTZ27_32400 [Streptomyces griseocarneus]|nr:hypothetical protein CTZ27_32400 [Streptomyces griseocarneus]
MDPARTQRPRAACGLDDELGRGGRDRPLSHTGYFTAGPLPPPFGKEPPVVDHERLPVFVYGTLRPGQGNHERFLLGRTAAEEPARLRGAVLYEGPGYPYAVADPEGEIHGDLITPAPAAYDAVLASLDALEGYAPGAPSSHYVRVTRPVSLERGGTVRAWVYLASPEVANHLRRRGTRFPGRRWPC